MTSDAFSTATPPPAWARLLFTLERAPRVAQKVWDTRQESHVHPDGSYEVSFPYSDDLELLDNILSFGPDVEVLAPDDLRQKVQRCLLAAFARYVRGADAAIFP